MWAGIWIDGRIDVVSDYLREIAAPAPTAEESVPVPAVAEPTPPPPRRDPTPESTLTPRRRANPSARQRLSYRSQVLARASGHCEIMAPGCRLSAHGYGYRTPEQPRENAVDAAQVYLRCDPCARTIADLDGSIAHRLGYLVVRQPWTADIPFFWRQSRWVCFSADGQLRDATAEAVA
jgi:hypothetical protein